MSAHKFDPKKLKKLNNPQRLTDIPAEYVWDKLSNKTPQTIVEIGAGTAFFCKAFLQHSQPERIYACDLSTIMIEWMEKHVTPQYPVIVPVQTGESQVPLDSTLSDLVFTINLHHELEQPEQLIKESRRLLQPGGEIIIIDWKKQEMQDGPPIHIRCTPEKISSQLQSSGFEEISVYDELKKHFVAVAKKP